MQRPRDLPFELWCVFRFFTLLATAGFVLLFAWSFGVGMSLMVIGVLGERGFAAMWHHATHEDAVDRLLSYFEDGPSPD